jgi:biotin-dependent carboxylase-like uncharacterized protein
VIEVLRPGPLAMVMDAGRPGYAAVGVSPSGAFDRGAFERGAGLVGNDPRRQAGVEITLGGFSFRALAGWRVALTGAACPVTVDGRDAAWDAAIDVNPGQVLSLGTPGAGLRSYLSVVGGVDAEVVLGSRSTDVLSGLGPSPLKAGDLLGVGLPPRSRPDVTAHRQPGDGQDDVLDLLPGPQTGWLLDAEALATAWTVSPNSNRVGVRLDGPELIRRDGEIATQPLVRGAVQVPPSGRPVVFGPDHPTTGGYPVVAVLTDGSCDRLAQLRPGQAFTLRWARSLA